eukprot:1830982-Pyramimonas_sp.AAC.1
MHRRTGRAPPRTCARVGAREASRARPAAKMASTVQGGASPHVAGLGGDPREECAAVRQGRTDDSQC